MTTAYGVELNVPRKIYVASSWRNNYQPTVVLALRDDGHEVYDFRNPAPDNHGFQWSEISPNWARWSPKQYITALAHRVANEGYALDWNAMQAADTGVLLLPSGRSAHIEAGYFVGANKPLHIYMPLMQEPELMYKMATEIHLTLASLRKALS